MAAPQPLPVHPSPAPILTRRELLASAGIALSAVALAGCATPTAAPEPASPPTPPTPPSTKPAGVLVNDVHSQLNLTTVSQILTPGSEAELAGLIAAAHRKGESVSVCGGRHAAGGQQFLHHRTLIDTGRLAEVHNFDPARGQLAIGAGAQWPAIVAAITAGNTRHGTNWAINQKQGGGQELSLGGSVSANAHGRCLNSAPIVSDVLSLRIVRPEGTIARASRTENAELFSLVAGGYGLFGAITQVTLQLVPRRKLQLAVARTPVDRVVADLAAAREAGAVHGDWQFTIDPAHPDFMRDGILTAYHAIGDDHAVTAPQTPVDAEAFIGLATLAHSEPSRAFELFAQSWHSRSGQVNWSDSWQTSDYIPEYHQRVDAITGATAKGTEALSEFYVPRELLPAFQARAAASLRESNAKLIYGVVRLIKADVDSFLPWAPIDQACVILNLHITHTPEAIAAATEALRRIAAIATELGGRFYLTYGRFATRQQLETGYPKLQKFLAKKREYDPTCTLRSDWYDWLTETMAAS